MSNEDVTLTLGGDSQNLIDALAKGGDAFTEFAKKTTSNAESLGKKLRELSGADVIGSANEYAKAVTLMGGATKLTTDEKTKLNASLAAALNKYKALGQEAPAALQKLAQETEPIPKKLSLIGDLTARLGPAMVAAFSVGAISKILGNFTELTGRLVDLESKTGLNVVALHKMQLVLGQSSVSLETAARASNEFQKRLAEGDKSVLGALERLGVDVAQLRALKPEDQFFLMADAVGKVSQQGQKISLVNDLFGKQGQELLPALNGKLKETADAYQRMGLVLDEDVIRAGDELGDQWTVLKAAGGGLIGSVLVPFVPLLVEVAGGITKVMTVGAPLLRWVIDIAMPFKVWGESIERATDALEIMGIKAAKLPDAHGPATEALNKSRQAAQSRMALGFSMSLEEEARATADLNRRVEESIKANEKAAAAVQQHANKIKDLREQLSGRKTQKDLADVREAWEQLSAQEQQEPQNIAVVIAMYDQLRARLRPDQLPTDLENLYRKANEGFENLKPIRLEDWITFDKNDPLAPIVAGFEKLKNLGPLAFTTLDKTFTGKPLETFSSKLIAGAAQLPAQIARAFTSGGGWQGALQGSAATMGAAAMGSWIGEVGKSGITKGLTGLSGQVLQAAGPVIGALAGPLVQVLVSHFYKPEYKRIMQDVGRQWGVNISEGLAKKIEADAGKLFGTDRVAGSIFNLDAIIKEDGGLSSGNIDKFTRKLRDVFSLFEQGKFTAANTAEVIDKNWSAFATHYTDASGRISASLKEIIALNDRMGVQSKEIAAWQRGQALSAMTGLTAQVEAAAAAWRAQHTAAADAKTELEDYGNRAVTVYAAAIAAGKTQVEALQAAGPLLRTLAQTYKDLGVETDNVALKNLLLQQTIVNANPQLISAIDGLKQEMIALDNLGLMNVDTFISMERTGTALYARLQAEAAAAGGTTRDALLPMQGYLQQAAAQAQLLGIPLDANTQLLINQSRELGIWRDQGKSANDIMADGFKSVADAVRQLKDFLMGVVSATQQIPRQIDVDVRGSWTPPENMDLEIPGHARGGLFRREHIARIAEGGEPEMVGSVGFMTRALSGALARMATMEASVGAPAGGLSAMLGGAGTVINIGDVHAHGVSGDPADFARSLKDELTEQLIGLVPVGVRT